MVTQEQNAAIQLLYETDRAIYIPHNLLYCNLERGCHRAWLKSLQKTIQCGNIRLNRALLLGKLSSLDKLTQKLQGFCAYRLVIINCAILSYLGVYPWRGCRRRRGRGRMMRWWDASPRGPLWHKKGSVGPPQFDAVIGHASNNLGVWLCRFQFQNFAQLIQSHRVLVLSSVICVCMCV